MLGARKDMINANMEMFKLNEAKGTKLFDAQMQLGLEQLRQSGENIRNQARTDATLQSPDRIAFMAALADTKTKEKPQGDPVVAYQSLMEMKRGPVSIEKLRGDWLDMSKRMQIQADYPNIKTFEDYVAVFGNTGGAGGAGSDGFKVVNVRPGP